MYSLHPRKNEILDLDDFKFPNVWVKEAWFWQKWKVTEQDEEEEESFEDDYEPDSPHGSQGIAAIHLIRMVMVSFYYLEAWAIVIYG